MAEEIGIVMSLYDKVSPTLKAIAGNSRAFDKSLEELAASLKTWEQAQNSLVTRSSALRTALAATDEKVKAARTSFRKLKDETSKGALAEAIAEQGKLTQTLTETEAAIKNNNAAYKELYKSANNAAVAASKADNRAGGGEAGGIAGLGKNLAASGVLKMLSGSVSGLAGAYLSSAIGEPGARMVSGIAGGALEGAAAGMVGGAPMAAMGALIGGLSGLVAGLTEIGQAQDDAFKSYYQEQYKSAGTRRASELESGTAIAGGRESTRMAFDKLLGGEEASAAYLRQVQRLAVDTNYTYDEITGYTKKLLNSFQSGTVLDILGELSDATAGLSLNSSDVDMFVSGLNRMQTLGKANREYLNYFDERGLDTSAALSSYLGVDKKAVAGMVTKGDISGETAVEAIRAYIREEYGGLSEDLAGSYNAMVSNLGDTMDNINAALGTAYSEKSKEGIGADMETYGGSLGRAMENMNTLIGEGKGIAENLDRQYSREAMSALLLGQDTTVYGEKQADTLRGLHEQYTGLVAQYQTATEEDKAIIAAQIEALKGEAESMAETAFHASGAMQGIQDVELELIAAIRENTDALGRAGWGNDYALSHALSIGGAGVRFARAEGTVSTTSTSPDAVRRGQGFRGPGAAYGLDRVPYDNFPALLHEGERVLTASEARAQDGGGGAAQVVITGNEFIVRSDADIPAIAAALADEIYLRRLGGEM